MTKEAKRSAAKPSLLRRVMNRVQRNNEIGARKALLEELFNDFHRSRRQVYMMNFWRGVFFGFGSVLGATVLIALVIWLLGQVVDLFPALADFINHLTDTMQRRR
ncbi:MAG: DUF5665 domain-containing protein [Candidatus Saccharibacteria bacterium]|nr:DUF5665 domain-containing protein [Candidatus Saccharibacteria bacterium]